MGRMKKSKANNFMKNKNRAAASKRSRGDGDASDGMDDEIDKFHKNREKIPFEDTDSEDEEFENPVLDLKGSESEDEEGEEDTDEDEDMEEEELNSMAAKIEKQAKILRQRRGVINEDSEEEESSEDEKTDWGNRKRNYYNADNVDYELQSSDEEGPALEEAEARRLQQKTAQSLRPEDFEQEDMDDEVDTLEELVEKENQADKSRDLDSMSMEKVKKDLTSLSKDEKLQVVMSNAPELVGLLSELRNALHELEHKVRPLLKKIEDEKIDTKEGRNYAELKHMLLLSYCQSIVFYLLLKAEGRSICDHPVIARLVEIRTLLEKVRVLDKTFERQVERFMSLDASSLPQMGDDSVPQKINISTETLKEQQADIIKVAEQPEDFVGEESKNMLREMERLEEKAKRDRLLGVTDVKLRRPSKRRAGMLDDLEDDLGTGADAELPKKLSQVINEAGRRQKKPKVISGDVDLPVKEDIGERRRKREMQKPFQKEVDADENNNNNKNQFEDEVYEEAKTMKLQKEAAKASVHSREPAKRKDDTPGGKRLITSEMEKNRGLTPYRKKASKNPRKKYKTKHGNAVIRRKGQVRDMKHETGPYEGEATGIRTNLSRSVRFN